MEYDYIVDLTCLLIQELEYNYSMEVSKDNGNEYDTADETVVTSCMLNGVSYYIGSLSPILKNLGMVLRCMCLL